MQLTKIFGEGETRVTALNSISVRFTRGTFTAIMGPSGSGKSTLMHCLAGLDRITSGQVFLAGMEISNLPDAKLTTLRRDNVGFIFQSFNLLPMLTAEENILLPLDLAGRKPDRALWDQLITGLGISDRLKHRPSELSGGQQQRVACARAMITKPHVVFADEPTGALDSKSGANLLGYLRHCVDDLGQTIIMVTHDAKAASYADRAPHVVRRSHRRRHCLPHRRIGERGNGRIGGLMFTEASQRAASPSRSVGRNPHCHCSVGWVPRWYLDVRTYPGCGAGQGTGPLPPRRPTLSSTPAERLPTPMRSPELSKKPRGRGC